MTDSFIAVRPHGGEAEPELQIESIEGVTGSAGGVRIRFWSVQGEHGFIAVPADELTEVVRHWLIHHGAVSRYARLRAAAKAFD
ncbi:hypothetical protein DKG74_04120 [Zavarzinia aquatilis]|uniref:Uncharacterized protein n=1 Tax=Zavarzinia aquatilis TaxID=2211142 RepID=A0A317EEB8_9PROT|nr:hypothetical protein DKG74_04120 [Zavarzinia aquatilis]